MTREIKFRAWLRKLRGVRQKKDEKMILLDREEYYFNSGRVWKEYWESVVEVEGAIIMQYTGLKDKNGVEIYEGDICTLGYEYGLGVVKFGEHDTSTDYYCDTAYGFFLETKEGDTFNLSYYVEIVLGNIYENPELIKADNKLNCKD